MGFSVQEARHSARSILLYVSQISVSLTMTARSFDGLDSGLDWHFYPIPHPHSTHDMLPRPGINDHAYNEYAFKQVSDLIEKYAPWQLFGDIDWPKA